MKVKFEGRRKSYSPKAADVVECHCHGVTTTWGALDGIQQLALSEGLCTTDGLPCLLAPERHIDAKRRVV